MKCRLCQSGSVDLHLDFGRQPIVHHLMDRLDQPYQTFPFNVGYCPTCGFMQLIDNLKPETLYKNYFTVSSWKSQPHAPRLIQIMECVFDLSPRTRILEIGCNDGSFMEKLVQSGYCNVLGIEPTEDAYNLAIGRGLNVINGFFGLQTSALIEGEDRPDIVVTRHVIEHIPDLHDFLDGIYNVLRSNGGLVLELPDHSMNYETLDYTFWEEHVNYFTFQTLTSLLAMHGFETVHHESTLYSGKAMFLFAQKKAAGRQTRLIRNLDHERATRYKFLYPRLKNSLHTFLESYAKRGVAVYGAGARSCNFVNLLGLKDYVEVFIDDQTEKQNKYVPGSERIIRSYIEQDDDDRFFLLGVNCENEPKVIKRRNLTAYASILPPSRYLPEFWRAISYLEA
jgi:2-polyprenyl-3-methyl-5-hydroxy-6-metoxy-1,4-benzoquinol methylase